MESTILLAQFKSVHKPIRRVSTRRHKQLKQVPDRYHFSSDLSPEIIKEQISMFCQEFSGIVVERSAFSTTVDETSVSMIVSTSEYQFSIIYHEMNGGKKP